MTTDTREREDETELQRLLGEAKKPDPPPVIDVGGLQAKLAQLETELEQTKRGLSTAHQTLTQKDRELKSQTDLRAEIGSIRDDLELLAIGFATKETGENPDGGGQSRQDILAEIQKRRQELDVKRKADAEVIARQEYNQKADAIWAQAKSIFGEGQEEKLEDIEDLLKSGNLVRAEQRIARASKTTVSKTEPPGETEEERIEKLVKERMEQRYPGIYSSESGIPGGKGGGSREEVRQLYIQGKISAEEANKRGANFS